MMLTTFAAKIRRRIWQDIVKTTRTKRCYFKLYKAYWNARYNKSVEIKKVNYLTAIPNPGAGIGHQMANWNAGYWYAKQFDLTFCHYPFSSHNWELFLGFGNKEVQYKELIDKKGFKKVRLPLFDENNKAEISLIKKIINSYGTQKVVFVCELDQFYKNQYGVIKEIKQEYNYPHQIMASTGKNKKER